MSEKRTNAEWLEALSADRESAWAALRDQVVRGLLSYLRSSRPVDVDARGFPALVEDATQETLLTVRAKLGTFRGESRLTTWVSRGTPSTRRSMTREGTSARPSWSRGSRSRRRWRSSKVRSGRAPASN